MRYLNKIIFIESANIRYSEVKLDGNVHLTGTQGVGKSTLLRALLFFYNANQQKLGIPVEKKRFVEFYFPYQNSFIIYEVAHENGSFCVLAYKSQGRVVFRFFNSEYRQSYFIHETDGRIAESWDAVRENLSRDRIKYTRLIDRYEEYRNIIYGNNKGLGAEFRKYALLESKRYQNIPRAIQHVFLNYKVESDFIKDTIIKSLNEDEMPIDLSTYTLHLKDFETQLNDIRLWTETVKGGNRIRKLAGSIVENHSTIRFIDQDFKRLAVEIMCRLKDNEEQQVKLDARRTKEMEKEAVIIQSQKSKWEAYEKSKNKLSEDKGVFVNKLKEARQKSEEYEQSDIQNILLRVARKSDLLGEQQNIKDQKALLETDFNEIKQRYEIQVEQLNNQFEAYRNIQQEKIQKLDIDYYTYKEVLAHEYEKIFSTIREQSESKIQQIAELIEEKKEESSRLRNRLFEAKNTVWYAQEINECKEKIRIANEQMQQAQNSIACLGNENSTLKTQWELKEGNVKVEAERLKNDNRELIRQLTEKITIIRTRIENSKDSLYGWLNKEYPGWEKNIGKVIDQEQVLFRTGLSPRKTNVAPDSLYGLQINLDEIEKEVKTVDDYESEIASLEKEIASLKIRNDAEDKRLADQLEALKKKYLPSIKKNKEEIERCKYNIGQETKNVEKANIELGGWEQRAEADKKARIDEVNQSFDKVVASKTEAENQLASVKAEIDRKIKTKQKEKEAKIKEKLQLTEADKEIIAQTIAERKEKTRQEVQAIRNSQTKELKDKGADTEKIASLEKQLQTIATELSFIEKHTELTFNYRKDEKELFSKVDYFKAQRDLLENKLTEAGNKYQAQLQKLRSEQDEIKSRITTYETQLAGFEADAQKFAEFQITEVYLDHTDKFRDTDIKTPSEKNGVTIIEELNGKYYSRLKEFNTLRENINKFTGNFSENNIFKFKTKLIEDAEYLQFAEDLREFIEEDKINEYEKRVNELFSNIIKQVGNETDQLLSKEKDIRKVINEINSDFVKRNFAGVIKSIELRMISSSNKIVQLLEEIKAFNDENLFNFGEMNLFNAHEQSREENNKKAVQYLSALSKSIAEYKTGTISLSDSFELEFKVIENDNDTGWVDKLANVGSDGTDVLVKAMINIMLLNVFKEGATKNQFKDFRLHCMMDEIGKLHPNNVRGILKFANDRNIFLVNGSPQSFDALAYKYTYKLSKQRDTQIGKDITIINRIITNNRI
ncbi:ATP-binding protein [Bacteroides sp. 51]|uniref:ATP-binding protein n=1 Tax=Bacteroides sp. 51 TaxID=2302938 RepID=UPI0013D70E2A|nr:ATP-binding protein [Bacteroides sp. 51]NDV83649.1 ATP-binding protein [Bacteroides sp. 51]